METKEKTYLTIGIFVVLAAIGITYYIAEGDTTYYCESQNIVGLCDRLSKVNDEGIQTRCYFYSEELQRETYKICTSGWISYEGLNVTGTPINDTGIWVDVEFEIDKVTAMKNKGITCPELTPCIKIDNFTCEARIYEKGGINKPIVVTYKFCEKYIEEKVNDTCIIWEIIETQGDCLNWSNETCLEYEILYSNGSCIQYSTKMVPTNECEIWKTLTQEELEEELRSKAIKLLDKIAIIEMKRQQPKEDVMLTETIKINITS